MNKLRGKIGGFWHCFSVPNFRSGHTLGTYDWRKEYGDRTALAKSRKTGEWLCQKCNDQTASIVFVSTTDSIFEKMDEKRDK